MSERYAKLYSLPKNLYAEGAPVIVSAGNLLKDNQTGKVLAQLKIKNIDAKTIKAAKVRIHALDTTGKAIDGDAEQEYLDFSAAQGEEFGQKVAIALPNASTRGFSVEVKQIAFTDNSTWDGSAAPWEPLPAGESLSSWLGDGELVKQYRIKFGEGCELAPREHRGLWLCACGAWNREPVCCACGKEKAVLLPLDLAGLKAEKDARLAKEKAEREAKEAADKAATEAAAEKAKKTKKTLAIVLPILAAVLALALLLTKVVIPNSRYNAAAALLEAGQYEEAITAFEALNGYKDSAERIDAAKNAIAEEERLAREAELEAENAAAYAKAEELLEAGEYDRAIAAFKALNGYRDSAERLTAAREAQTEAKNAAAYANAEALLAEGKTYEAALAFYQIKDYRDAWERCFQLWGQITQRETLSAGGYHTVGLRADGTVAAVGSNKYGQCEVSGWRDIIAISAGGYHTVGLKADGTVVATKYTGAFNYGQCEVSGWRDIVAISGGSYHTVGLKADGTVIAVGDNGSGQCEVSGWRDIVAISAGTKHTAGLKVDGTVVATGSFGAFDFGQCDVNGWRNIIAISAGCWHTVGLKADGTVIAVGYNKYGQCEVSGWRDLVAVFAGPCHTVGLRADGTVVATDYLGKTKNIQWDVSDWKDIVAIAAGEIHTVGLRADGTVVATEYTGKDDSGQCDVSDWRDIKLPD